MEKNSKEEKEKVAQQNITYKENEVHTYRNTDRSRAITLSALSQTQKDMDLEA